MSLVFCLSTSSPVVVISHAFECCIWWKSSHLSGLLKLCHNNEGAARQTEYRSLRNRSQRQAMSGHSFCQLPCCYIHAPWTEHGQEPEKERSLFYRLIKLWTKSMGRGKMIVEFFSAEIAFNVWRYRSCKAAGDSQMTSAASLRARDALCSPSAASTWVNAWNII